MNELLMLLILKILFIFAALSLGLWFFAGRFLTHRHFAVGEGRQLILGKAKLAMSLAIGLGTSCVFLLLSNWLIARDAKHFFLSEKNNISLQVIKEELGHSVWPEASWDTIAQVSISASDVEKGAGENGVGEDSESAQAKKLKEKLFQDAFRQAYCQDTNDLRLLSDKFSDVFKVLMREANARKALVLSLGGVIQKGEKQPFVSDQMVLDIPKQEVLNDYLDENFLNPLWKFGTANPDPEKVLRGIAKPIGYSSNKENEKQEQTFQQRDAINALLNKGLEGEDGPVYEKIFLAHLGRMTKLMQPFYRARQMVFGSIQILTLALFFMGIALLRWRTLMLWNESQWIKNIKPGDAVFLGHQFLKLYQESQKEQDSTSLERLIQWKEQIKERVLEIEYTLVDYLIWAMPSLGFIGTVLGIGFALGNADQVVRATDPASQAQAITGVTSLLSVAFDTTLIALVCGIPLMALMYWRKAAELRFLDELPGKVGAYWKASQQKSDSPSGVTA